MPTAGNTHGPVDRELSKLDPWSFHVLEGDGVRCDRVVVGTTGAFVLVLVEGRPPLTRRAREIRAARRGGRKLTGHLRSIGVQSEVIPVVSVDGVFAPRSVGPVRVVPRVLLAREISGRSRTTMPHQAERAARRLSSSFAQTR